MVLVGVLRTHYLVAQWVRPQKLVIKTHHGQIQYIHRKLTCEEKGIFALLELEKLLCYDLFSLPDNGIGDPRYIVEAKWMDKLGNSLSKEQLKGCLLVASGTHSPI